MHLRGEGLVHISQLREDFTTHNLLFIQLDNALSDKRLGSTSTSTLNNWDLGNAKSASLLHHSMLHLRALLQLLLDNLGDWGLLNHLLAADNLLLLKGLLFTREGRTRLILNSERESSSLIGLSNARLSIDNVLTSVSMASSTETMQFSYWDEVGIFNFNNVSVGDDSHIWGLNNNKFIRGSVQSVSDLLVLGDNLLSLMTVEVNILFINFNFDFTLLVRRLQDNLGSKNKGLDRLLSLNLFSHNRVLLVLAGFSSENMVAVIKGIGVGLVSKGLDNMISNSALGIDRRTLDQTNKVFIGVVGGSNWQKFLNLFRKTDVAVSDGTFLSGQNHANRVHVRVELQINLDLSSGTSGLEFSHVRDKDSLNTGIQHLGPHLDILRHGTAH